MLKHNVLFELGCEELPPKSLLTLKNALDDSLKQLLTQAGLHYSELTVYAAPRRLAAYIQQLDCQQADTLDEKRGPAASVAFAADGSPTPALQGFLRSANANLQDIERVQTEKGEWLVVRKVLAGQASAALLPSIIQQALDALPIAKRMRSGASRTEFVRPVQWVVLMQGDAVVPAVIQGLSAANITYGHRFHAPAAISIDHADAYVALLRAANVMVDFAERRDVLVAQTTALAKGLNGVAIMPTALVDEVTGLVEWPVALACQFESRFLAVPQEALISTMQDNQKYFCLLDGQGKLLPNFITISNIHSKDPSQIVQGNEKVVRPRLADAEFFYQQDQKTPLEERRAKLEKMVFHPKLGSLQDKSNRVAKLAAELGGLMGANAAHINQAAHLAKCDLCSDMVGEFPELQGIAGRYYALAEGLPAEVAEAIGEQYLPKFAGDVLPKTTAGSALAIADRLDTLVGIFGVGQPPTGNKDPFSLRRAAIAVLRLMIDKGIDVPLHHVIAKAVAAFEHVLQPDTAANVEKFMQGRYKAMYEDQGVAVDVIMAVNDVPVSSPLDFDKRIKAVSFFKGLPAASVLVAANKRVNNILAKHPCEVFAAVQQALLQLPAEQALFAKLNAITPTVRQAVAAHDYAQAMSLLSELKGDVDVFFEQVMVMCDDVALKANRINLLAQLQQQFAQIADIAKIQVA